MIQIKPIIYVASPYSDSDEAVVKARLLQVTHYTAHLNKIGHVAFSPIVHGHQLAETLNMPTDFDFWQTHCLSFLSVCNEMRVLMIPGWEKSIGVKAEIVYANKNNIPVFYTEITNETEYIEDVAPF
jgi:hypothetical protein